jgi:diketogulonate reductase-like aldo/keto reductase
MYNTELEIGVAIKKSGIPRSQLYVQQKSSRTSRTSQPD